MIRIYRPSSDASSSFAELASHRPGPVFQVDRTPCLRRSWNGVRCLLEDFAERDGERLRRVLERHRTAASLVLDDLEPGLEPAERAARGELEARVTSHLSHNWAVQRPFFESWASLLADLFEGSGVMLRISDLRRLDWETTAALKALYRAFPRRSPDLVLHDATASEAPSEAGTDGDGILWRTRPDYIAQTVMGFEILPDTEVVADAAGSPDAVAETGDGDGEDVLLPSSASCLETGVVHALASVSGRPGADLAERTVRAVEVCFRRCAFTTALRLGLDLVESGAPLTPRQAASVHAIIALSAHNRQFHTEGNQPLAAFIGRHLEAALAAEDRPEERCALLYRLAVTRGRRQGRLEPALDHAGEAIRLSREAGLAPLKAGYQEAWARNIRAYAWMRLGKVDEGDLDLEEAFRVTEAVTRDDVDPGEPASQAWWQDLVLSRTLVASNLAALGFLHGDRERAHRWRSVGHELEKEAPGIEHYEASHWLVFCRDFHLPKLGLGQALEGLRSARAENDALGLHRVLLLGADLNDRLGRVHSAVRLLRAAHDLRRRLAYPQLLDRAELPAAAACSRAGRFAEARQWLIEALIGRRTPRMEAVVHAAMALVAARAGHEETARVSIGKALAQAEAAGGGPAGRAGVLVAAGRALERLGSPDEAREAYREALRLGGEAAGGAAQASAAQALRVRLGLLGTAAPEPDEAAQSLGACLEHLPAALSHAETWWDLRRLLEALGRVAAPDRERLFAEGSEGLEHLVLAAGQRRDCTTALSDLGRAVPRVAELAARAVPPVGTAASRPTAR